MSTNTTDQFSFTKLVVNDLEANSTFYQRVFGLSEMARVDDEIAGRPISEIMFNPTGEGAATFVVLAYTDTDTPAGAEVIAGFITEDLQALVDRAVDAGGKIHEPIKSMPEHGVKVAFLNDIEGHVLEAVELLT